MTSELFSDQQIVAAWHKNAKPWAKAVRNKAIASRVEVTDQAIISVLSALNPVSLLDIGCGEGWLCGAMADRGVKVTGVDVVPELIASAKSSHSGDFYVMSYQALAQGYLRPGYDVAVCNFSLLGEQDVEMLFAHIGGLLNASGHFVMQTLHPKTACGDNPYEDGWREGSWQGFSDEFAEPAPWFFAP